MMKSELLKKKLERYQQGSASPAEIRQIQTWLSSDSSYELQMTEDEKKELHYQILFEVQCHTAYPLFYPRKESKLKKVINWINSIS